MKDYVSKQGKTYAEPARTGFLSLPVLPFLWGQPWNQLALNFIHSLRPSTLRVVPGEETTDAVSWRVTVRLDGDMIRNIDQEVAVGLEEDYQHGHDLYCRASQAGIQFDPAR